MTRQIGDAIGMRPKPMRTSAEDTEINVNDATEMKRWREQLGVTEEKIRDAVMNAGNKLGDVEKEIAKQSSDDGDITPVEEIPDDRSLHVTSDGVKQA